MNKLIKNKNPFTVVPNALAQSTSLSLKAKGIYLYLNSKPSDWQFYNKLVCSENNIGVDSWRSGINELVTDGWLIKSQSISTTGNYGGNTYELVYTPNNPTGENIVVPKNKTTHRKSPSTENPCSENPCSENTDTTKKEVTNKDKIKKEYIYKRPISYMDLSMVGFSDCENIKLTQSEYDTLLARFGGSLISQLIEQLDGYLCDHPNKYKSHCKVLRSWALKHKTETPQKKYESVQEHNKRIEIELGLTPSGLENVLK